MPRPYVCSPLSVLFPSSPAAAVERFFFPLFRTSEVGPRNMLNGPARRDALLPRFYITRAYLSVGLPLTNWHHRGRDARDPVEGEGIINEKSARLALIFTRVVFGSSKKSVEIDLLTCREAHCLGYSIFRITHCFPSPCMLSPQ